MGWGNSPGTGGTITGRKGTSLPGVADCYPSLVKRKHEGGEGLGSRGRKKAQERHLTSEKKLGKHEGRKARLTFLAARGGALGKRGAIWRRF